jgi:hypothetical protein
VAFFCVLCGAAAELAVWVAGFFGEAVCALAMPKAKTMRVKRAVVFNFIGDFIMGFIVNFLNFRFLCDWKTAAKAKRLGRDF